MNNEPTISDVLDAIGDFSTKVDGRFERIESEITGIKSEITGIKSEITGIKSEITGTNSRLTRVESQMVTKAYLDDKLIDLKADLTVVMRKEDHKLEALTRLLASKKVISEADANGILMLEPFPQNI